MISRDHARYHDHRACDVPSHAYLAYRPGAPLAAVRLSGTAAGDPAHQAAATRRLMDAFRANHGHGRSPTILPGAPVNH